MLEAILGLPLVVVEIQFDVVVVRGGTGVGVVVVVFKGVGETEVLVVEEAGEVKVPLVVIGAVVELAKVMSVVKVIAALVE